MHWLGWIVVALAFTVGGWFAFDGWTALITGDYVTPKSGPHAGGLGTWSKVVQAVGIDPRSTLMKVIFLVYGVAWLVLIVCFILQMPWAWWAMLIAAVGALWYLPFGTLLGVIQVILLMLPTLRSPGAL